MSDPHQPRAHVRLTGPAFDDLTRLVRLDPQVARQALKKMILLERDPLAGEPLMGALVGFRKLTVGDRHWRIVWRATTDASGQGVIEIAEVWAAGARSDGEVYVEMIDRVAQLPDSLPTRALADVIQSLGTSAGRIAAKREPSTEPVPEWLIERLVHTAGLERSKVETMTPEQAMQTWEAFITQPRD